MSKEIIHKEIEVIQAIISRMAQNSFLLKGWMITLVVGVLALTKDTLIVSDIDYLPTILSMPLLMFWYLDAFFLHKERCYRKLYAWIIQQNTSRTIFRYDLDYTRFKDQVNARLCIMFSLTLIMFYGIPLLILIMIFIYNLTH